MPLYEYRCQKCGHVDEVLQKFSDPPLRRCKVCKGKVEKLISRTSFQLKGGGWFDQGYGGSSSSPSSPSSPSKSSTSSESPSSSSSSSSSSSDKKKSKAAD